MTNNVPDRRFDELDAAQKYAVLSQLAEWVVEPHTFPANIREFVDAFEGEHGLLARQWLLYRTEDAIVSLAVKQAKNEKPDGDFEALNAIQKCNVRRFVERWVNDPDTFPENDKNFWESFERNNGLPAKLWLLYKYREALLKTV